jgi:AraC family transcriptional regulator
LEQHAVGDVFEKCEHVNERAHILHLHHPSRTEWRLDGRARSTRIEPNSSSLLPAGSHVAVVAVPDSPATGLILAIDARQFQRNVAESTSGGVTELKQQIVFSDPQITLLMTAMKTDLEEGSPAGRLYGETLGNALSVYLSQRYATQTAKMQVCKGGLTKFQLNRVLDYIESSLNEDIRLSSLAEATGLSISHFATAFKQNTGLSPHQYVLHRRIARAKELLRNSVHSVLEASALTGFVDQSHFSKVFRRLVGITPREFRARS